MTLDLVSKNPFLLVVLGDFNAKLSQRHVKDSSTSKGNSIDSITSEFGLHKIINEPTNILGNSLPYIDLLFILKSNLSVKSGTQPSFHPNCHYQIIYTKFNLEAFHPPPYTREVWHYQYANVDLIRRSINQFDWDRTLANKRVDGKVFIFNKIVLHIPSNFVPHEVIG